MNIATMAEDVVEAAQLPPTHDKIAMDTNGFVSMASMLEAFNEPLNEEQAWAVCYQAAKYLRRHHAIKHEDFQLQHLSDLKIHKDGHVHISTVQTGELRAFRASRPRYRRRA